MLDRTEHKDNDVTNYKFLETRISCRREGHINLTTLITCRPFCLLVYPSISKPHQFNVTFDSQSFTRFIHVSSRLVNMLSQTIVALISLLIAVSAAPQSDAPPSTLPASTATTTTTAAPTVTPIGVEYYLQAQPLSENPDDVVNNYLSSFHSGAGENNVTLVPRSEATDAFLNPDGGYQEFDLGVSYPYGFVMGVETAIKGASLVSIDAGAGDAGFSIPSAEEGLTWNDTAFGGWLACNITTQTTGLQLFWVNETGERKEKVPKACERVRLAPEYF